MTFKLKDSQTCLVFINNILVGSICYTSPAQWKFVPRMSSPYMYDVDDLRLLARKTAQLRKKYMYPK